MAAPGVAFTIHLVVPGSSCTPACTCTSASAESPSLTAAIVAVPGASAVTSGGSSADSVTISESLVVHDAADTTVPYSSRSVNVATSLTSIVRCAGLNSRVDGTPTRDTVRPTELMWPSASMACSVILLTPGRSITTHATNSLSTETGSPLHETWPTPDPASVTRAVISTSGSE